MTLSDKKLAPMRGRQANRRKVLESLHSLYDVGVEYPEFSAQRLTDEIGDPVLTISKVTVALQDLERDAKVISRRMTFRLKDGSGLVGRQFHITLTSPLNAALEKLSDLDRQEVEDFEKNSAQAAKQNSERFRGRKKVKDAGGQSRYIRPETRGKTDIAIRYEDEQPVEAIVGPDAPSPFAVLAPVAEPTRGLPNEPLALIEAARQYVSRTGGLTSKIEDVISTAKELGIAINESALRESVGIERDDRLETIALVLPYIDELERRLARTEEPSKRPFPRSNGQDLQAQSAH